jgi:hypothetical protein
VPPAARRPPYLASLRVFEPVAHLPGPVRQRWVRYAQGAPGRRELEGSAFVDSVRRLAARPPVPLPPRESTDAVLIDQDGELYVCPLQPRLQAWQGIGTAEALVGAAVLGEVVPASLREQAVADLAAHAGSGGEVRLFTRTATWQVPLAWFVLFDGSERLLRLEGERSLRYRTPMAAARRRCARGLRTAREHLADTDVVDDLEQLGRWLEEFDPRSLVELDYAGLVDLLDDLSLRGDDSASDVAEGLAALAEGDTTSAAAAYRRLSTRWQRLALLARAS